MKSFYRLAGLAIITLLFVQCSGNTKNNTAENSSSNQGNQKEWATKTANGFTYRYVENDPSHTRFYTLDNGLSVILSPSHKKPRIQTYIAVKAGSKTDPADHTGLAHYLEHMLFKGTPKFGTLNFAKEKPLLDSITALYEVYNSTTDEAKREKIYAKIDAVSGEAAHYAIANEYDKMMAAMGAKGTNAFTSFEQTVYTEDIPNNVIDKYLAVQAERFRHPVFRLFHTELEAVYEEKNRSLDSDGSKVFKQMFALLFPHNNYGQQTTIGTIHDLKNPSLNAIRDYFNTYYVPNNMGIVMAGDFDPDKVIKKIADAFGGMKSQEVPPYTVKPEAPLTSPKSAEVFGPEPARIMLGYRFPGASSEDAQMLNLIGEILTNGTAGLIDLDLVKKQKLLSAYAFPYVLKDYSTLLLGGSPVKGQDLDAVKKLLLQEIGKLKSGDFNTELLVSIINNEKKAALQTNANYNRRASKLMNNFVLGTDWLKRVNYVDWLSAITKQDVIDFAKTYFHNNYVAIYKRQGEDKHAKKVEKPAITPVDVNRDAQSDFLKQIADMSENPIKPDWLNYDEDLQKAKAGNYQLLAVQNTDNQLFNLDYYFKTGSWSNKLLPIAAGYLNYIGTKDKTAEEVSQEFYKLATTFYVNVNSEESYVVLSGLQENFKESVALFDELLKHCVADQEALEGYIKRLKKSRKNAKDRKGNIKSALRSYALYGAKNPFNHVLTTEELESLKAQDLVDLIHDMIAYNHTILYYGPKSVDEIATVMAEIHQAPQEFVKLPEPVIFDQKRYTQSKVFLAHYNMVQAEIYWEHNGDIYTEEMRPEITLFNQYFGGGMQSIVFQTLRESKALAYSTYAYFSRPSKKNRRTTFTAYIGSQADKFPEAVDGMNALLTTLPKSIKNVTNAKKSLRKKMASKRIKGMGIIWSYLNAKEMGRDTDIRETVYNEIAALKFEDLKKFYQQEVKGKPYAYCIVAGEGKLDQAKLRELGKVQVIPLEELFGY